MLIQVHLKVQYRMSRIINQLLRLQQQQIIIKMCLIDPSKMEITIIASGYQRSQNGIVWMSRRRCLHRTIARSSNPHRVRLEIVVKIADMMTIVMIVRVVAEIAQIAQLVAPQMCHRQAQTQIEAVHVRLRLLLPLSLTMVA